MIGVVERVDDEVRRARVLRILPIHLLDDRRRESLAAEALVAGPHRAEQRQRVEGGHLVIVRPLGIQPRHGVGVGVVARELVAWRVEQPIGGADEGLLLGRAGLCDSALQRRRDLLERALSGLRVLLRPQRVVVAHRLAPVGHHEVRIRLLRALERLGGLVELEAVKVLHAFEKRRLRAGRAGGRKGDGAELLRRQRRGRESCRPALRQTRGEQFFPSWKPPSSQIDRRG